MTKTKERVWLPLPRYLKALEKGGSCWELSITENHWDRGSKMKVAGSSGICRTLHLPLRLHPVSLALLFCAQAQQRAG